MRESQISAIRRRFADSCVGSFIKTLSNKDSYHTANWDTNQRNLLLSLPAARRPLSAMKQLFDEIKTFGIYLAMILLCTSLRAASLSLRRGGVSPAAAGALSRAVRPRLLAGVVPLPAQRGSARAHAPRHAPSVHIHSRINTNIMMWVYSKATTPPPPSSASTRINDLGPLRSIDITYN